MSEKVLKESDLACLTGVDEAKMQKVFSLLNAPPLSYSTIDHAQQETIKQEIDTAINERDMRISGENDSSVWQRGWDEVAQNLEGKEIDYLSLRPQYFRDKTPPCRLLRQFIMPSSPDFEYLVGLHIRGALIAEHLPGVERIVEFGCGTGINIYVAAHLFPEAELIGTDWAAASARILAAMGEQTGKNISGHQFNMLIAEGWDGANIDSHTGILTVHAMEQLHTNWQSFLDYVLERKPAICVHIEPILELYDPENDFDDLARRYHLKRHYLNGFLPKIDQMAEAGEVEVVARKRVQFGGQYHEAYSVLVWRL